MVFTQTVGTRGSDRENQHNGPAVYPERISSPNRRPCTYSNEEAKKKLAGNPSKEKSLRVAEATTTDALHKKSDGRISSSRHAAPSTVTRVPSPLGPCPTWRFTPPVTPSSYLPVLEMLGVILVLILEHVIGCVGVLHRNARVFLDVISPNWLLRSEHIKQLTRGGKVSTGTSGWGT